MKKIQKLPSIKRLPNYLHKLLDMQKHGQELASTTVLAQYMNLEPIVVRKDLAITGVTGQPGVGYKTDELIQAIRDYLGWNNTYEAILVGAGCLGSALIGYEGFKGYGLDIIAAFDTDPEKIGQTIHDRPVFPMSKLPDLAARLKVNMGILCVPDHAAQAAAEIMVESGIKAIWNFTTVSLKLPEDIVIQREVIAGGLAVLSIKLTHKIKELEQEDI
jgi:redox-sensing transcriptional repressor